MADIFISYSSNDQERVEPLVGELVSAGYTVWWDRNLYGGNVFSKEIEAEIAKAKIVLVIWTDQSLASQWVTDEAELGRRFDKLLPIRLDDVEPPIGFRQIQTIDCAGWTGATDDAGFQTLLTSCGQMAHPSGSKGATVSSETPNASIAVLPLVNMSSDPEQEFFSDGISEELLNLLAKIKQMRVAARTSSFAFKGTDTRVKEIGDLLGVAHVLEGSVRKAGAQIRITAQLIETATGFHLWSETYDRTLDDIFVIQDEIAAAIVEALREHILGEVLAPEMKESINVEAYENFLMGRQLLNRRLSDTIKRGKGHFEKALALAPDYSPALIGLADAHILLSCGPTGGGFFGNTPIEEALGIALPLLERALEIDPNSEEAYAVLSIAAWTNSDSVKAHSYAQKAIALNANYAPAYRALAFAQMGDPCAPIIPAFRKGLQLDPLSAVNLFNVAAQILDRGRYEEAMSLFDKIHTVDPSAQGYVWGKIVIAVLQGKLMEALTHFAENKVQCLFVLGRPYLQQIMTHFGQGEVVEHMSLSRAMTAFVTFGYPHDANRLSKKLEQRKEDYESSLALASWYCQNERYEEALTLLSPFDKEDPNDWGPHFDESTSYAGARYSYFARKSLGDLIGANAFEQKLRKVHEALCKDTEGLTFVAHHLGAVVALMDGEREQALDAVERQVERLPALAIEFNSDPLLKELVDEPRFQKAMACVKDHIAAEKQAAFDAGLLPLSEEVISWTKE